MKRIEIFALFILLPFCSWAQSTFQVDGNLFINDDVDTSQKEGNLTVSGDLTLEGIFRGEMLEAACLDMQNGTGKFLGSGISMGWNNSVPRYSIVIGKNHYHMGTEMILAVGSMNRAVGAANSIVAGSENLISHECSFAFGRGNEVGANAFASGCDLISNTLFQFTVGNANDQSIRISPSTSNGWYPEDPLFVVGNGTSKNARSNAMVIRKNGNLEVNGSAVFSGDIVVKQPSTVLSMGRFGKQTKNADE